VATARLRHREMQELSHAFTGITGDSDYDSRSSCASRSRQVVHTLLEAIALVVAGWDSVPADLALLRIIR